jgi:hypothetical protein
MNKREYGYRDVPHFYDPVAQKCHDCETSIANLKFGTRARSMQPRLQP